MVIQRMQVSSGMIGRKGSVGDFLSPSSNPNPRQVVKTTKVEYGKGRGNFRWSGEIHRDRKEHCMGSKNLTVIVEWNAPCLV